MQRTGRVLDQRPEGRWSVAAILLGSLLVTSVSCVCLPRQAVASPPVDRAMGTSVAASWQQTGTNARMTTITVSSGSQLQAAFASAKDGDRIELVGGNYGSVTLSGRSFAAGVTIASANASNPAVLEDLTISRVSGLTLADFEVDGTTLGIKGGRVTRVAVSNSQDLTFTGLKIEGHIPTAAEGVDPKAKSTGRMDAIAGYGYDLGLRFIDSKNITVSQSEFGDLKTAIGLTNSTGMTFTGLDIHDAREGFNMHDVRDVTIEQSHFHAFKPWRSVVKGVGDHADMIQYWGDNSSFGVHDVTIQNNLFQQTEDYLPTQTIYGSIRNAGPNVTATNFTISGNTIVNGHLNAIALYNVDGAVIDHNLLLPNARTIDDPTQLHTPGIVLVGTHNVTLSANSFLRLSNQRPIKADLSDPSIDLASDNVILSTSPSSPLFWRKFVGNLLVDSLSGANSPTSFAALADPADGFGLADDDTAAANASGTASGSTHPSPDTLMKTFGATALAVLQGTTGDDILSVRGSENTVLLGGDGNDRLNGGEGNDLLIGGDGADKFVFDLRQSSPASRHTIADLDFSAGDRVQVLVQGDAIWLTDAASILSAEAAGDISIIALADGVLEIAFAGDPDRVLELNGTFDMFG